MDPPTPLAAYIRELRKERNLTQEALAQLAHMDKPQVNRLEKRAGHHERGTFLRLAQALELEPRQKERLFTLAGYHPPWEAPTQEDAARVMDVLRDRWLAHAQLPCAVTDAHWTLWHVNEHCARLISTRLARDLFGRHALEVCFDPSLGMRVALRRLLSDMQVEQLCAGMVARFKLLSYAELHEPWRLDLVAHLARFPEFSILWDAPAQASPDHGMRHARLLRLENGGDLVIHHAPVEVDWRFSLAFVAPVGARAAMLLDQLLVRPN